MSEKKESRKNMYVDEQQNTIHEKQQSKDVKITSFTFLRKLTINQISASYINISNEKIMTGHFPGELEP